MVRRQSRKRSETLWEKQLCRHQDHRSGGGGGAQDAGAESLPLQLVTKDHGEAGCSPAVYRGDFSPQERGKNKGTSSFSSQVQSVLSGTVVGEWCLLVLISTTQPFIVSPLPCPAEEGEWKSGFGGHLAFIQAKPKHYEILVSPQNLPNLQRDYQCCFIITELYSKIPFSKNL